MDELCDACGSGPIGHQCEEYCDLCQEKEIEEQCEKCDKFICYNCLRRRYDKYREDIHVQYVGPVKMI